MSQLLTRTRHFLKPKQLVRTYWSQLTTTAPSFQECVLTSLDSFKGMKPDVCVALISKSYAPHEYQILTKALSHYLQPTLLIGGVIDRVPEFNHGISLLLGFNEKVVPITLRDSQDRLKIRNTSVGRWGRVHEKERTRYQNEFIDSGNAPANSVSTPAQPLQLPPGLEEKPSFIFTVSDNEPDQLLQTLDHHYPDVPKVGIIGASTPFVTGSPFTLFQGEEMLDAGIVGFASYQDTKLDVKTHHSALEKLGEPMKITNCKGNVILDLEENGATGLLLRLIQNSNNYSKDEEFYLGVYPLDQEQLTDESVSVSRITSGDPGRGNMSIDTTADLQKGQVVQFLRKKNLEFKNISSELIGKDNVVFGVSGKDYTIDAAPMKKPFEIALLHGVFGGVSENGVISGRQNIPSEILDVPYSKVTFKL